MILPQEIFRDLNKMKISHEQIVQFGVSRMEAKKCSSITEERLFN